MWHSLTEDGQVEVVNIQFGKNFYENVSVKHLKPIKMEAQGHPAEKEKKVKKKPNNEVKEIVINGTKYRPVK